MLPDVGSDPLQLPAAMQPVAPVEVQVSTNGCPVKTLVGLAEIVTVGAAPKAKVASKISVHAVTITNNETRNVMGFTPCA
jgi:hypothetical protein